MKSQKEFIKQFREIINPSGTTEGDTIPNLMKLFTSLPATSYQSIQPNQVAPPIPPATQQNVQASVTQPEPPPPKLSKNFPYPKVK
jgi:hypothetical protein